MRTYSQKKKILTVFGTRPEVIKMAPVIRELEQWGERFETINVATGQHSELLYPFVELFGIDLHYDLRIMEKVQSPADVCARVLLGLSPVVKEHQPDMILVQGDTSTTLAGALAGFYGQVAVGHIEAGLRTANAYNPFPEEMNRRLVSRVATYHFAATDRNRDTLLAEGVSRNQIFVTGNPVVDALQTMMQMDAASDTVRDLLAKTEGKKRLVVTLHRRESMDSGIVETMKVLRSFADREEDVAIIFPVHPNPRVREVAANILQGNDRIHLVDPLDYKDFIYLLSRSWLIVADSGGIQEEAPTLGIPLLIVRENTERPEALETGFIRLVKNPLALSASLEQIHRDRSIHARAQRSSNPFGEGDSARRIVDAIASVLSVSLYGKVAEAR
jgi:UDP-N-acetylglucosamine 2-epimerase (non-hydrolysing)